MGGLPDAPRCGPAETARIGHSVRHKHLAVNIPDIAEPLLVTVAPSVFVATR